MTTAEAKEKYAARQHRDERPFAPVKYHFGARQLLLRSLKNIRIEWTWLMKAFNLRNLITLPRRTPGSGEIQEPRK